MLHNFPRAISRVKDLRNDLPVRESHSRNDISESGIKEKILVLGRGSASYFKFLELNNWARKNTPKFKNKYK